MHTFDLTPLFPTHPRVELTNFVGINGRDWNHYAHTPDPHPRRPGVGTGPGPADAASDRMVRARRRARPPRVRGQPSRPRCPPAQTAKTHASATGAQAVWCCPALTDAEARTIPVPLDSRAGPNSAAYPPADPTCLCPCPSPPFAVIIHPLPRAPHVAAIPLRGSPSCQWRIQQAPRVAYSLSCLEGRQIEDRHEDRHEDRQGVIGSGGLRRIFSPHPERSPRVTPKIWVRNTGAIKPAKNW